MKHIILFDDEYRDNLLPLVYTRPVADLRVGILRIYEKWEIALQAKASFITQDYLSEKYPIQIHPENIIINGALLPNPKVLALIDQLGKNEAILLNGRLVAANLNQSQFQKLISDQPINELNGIEIDEIDDFSFINYPWDIFTKNGDEIHYDFERLCSGRTSENLPEHCVHYGNYPVFIEEGAKIRPCIINTEEGPVYIGKDAEVMENSVIRGPFSLGEGSVVKMGAKIYSNSSIGPHSKVGGELNNVVIQSYSNKGHDGFLGNAVLGSWCNIGADSNNSNLKNNYARVKHWNYTEQRFIDTGLQFCGLIMGDHSKCAINSMFNTGTSVGVSANLFGDGFPRNFVPSFAWGGAKGYKTFQLEKAYETASIMMARRGIELDPQDRKILQHVYELSAQYRNWETS